jgi:5-methylcytosine-specific restriction endonuclease McrA
VSQHHRQSKWANYAKKARAQIKAQLPLACVHCGSPVFDDAPWDVGHLFDLAKGGDAKTFGASHRKCNRSAGGREGAKIVNQKKKNLRTW